ncbi:uncharacterized protein ARMOST_19642 [Armillaria ostoyae]|uniref:Uncharacterized protein n=3 Tax=Armillaria TaxID=47424 RepID=A0A284S547_ARMOS|nr:uncharacterized protein ARMOST_19642 [Armillaria ostoyae]
MSAPQTQYAPTQSSSVLGGQIVGRSERQAVAPPAALKLRLDLNLEVEIAIQAKVNGDITLSLLESSVRAESVLQESADASNMRPEALRRRPSISESAQKPPWESGTPDY